MIDEIEKYLMLDAINRAKKSRYAQTYIHPHMFYLNEAKDHLKDLADGYMSIRQDKQDPRIFWIKQLNHATHEELKNVG